QIISLEEFLDWFQKKPLQLNLELKNNKIDYQNLEQIVYEMLDHYRLLSRTTLSTFSPQSVKRLKRFKKKVEIAFLTSKKRPHLVHYTKELGANALHIKYRLLNQNLVKTAQQHNLPIRVYTVNRKRQMLTCFKYQ